MTGYCMKCRESREIHNGRPLVATVASAAPRYSGSGGRPDQPDPPGQVPAPRVAGAFVSGAGRDAVTVRQFGAKCPVRTNPGHEVCQAVQSTRLNDTIPWPPDINAAGVRLRY